MDGHAHHLLSMTSSERRPARGSTTGTATRCRKPVAHRRATGQGGRPQRTDSLDGGQAVLFDVHGVLAIHYAVLPNRR